MRRVVVIGVQVLAAIVIGLAVRELWLAHQGDGTRGAIPEETISVTTELTPDVHTFGQPVVATVTVLADATLVRPESIRLDTDFAPYDPDGAPSIERSRSGGSARVVFRYRLSCLREGCDAAGARGIAQFEPGFVRYRFQMGSGPGRDIVDWPAIVVASRVSPIAVERISWRAPEGVLAPVTSRLTAGGLAALLVGAALVVLGAAVLLARRLWRVEPRVELLASGAERSRLHRALERARAEHDNGSPSPERRRSLERLARELGSAGLAGLADEARSLAWSPRESTADDVERLARRAEDAARHGALA